MAMKKVDGKGGYKKPHPKVSKMLAGPYPPDDFPNDGCTMSPDGWFYDACRRHDWAYSKLRQNWAVMEKTIDSDAPTVAVWCYPDLDFGVNNDFVKKTFSPERANLEWMKMKNMTDEILRYNIQILSVFTVNKKGEVVKRKLPWRRYGGFAIGKLYGRVTNTFNFTARGIKDHDIQP